MRRLYLRDCVPGDLIDDVFVVSGKQFSPTTTGKHFIKAFVGDRSCQVTARMWNATRELFNAMPDGGFVQLRGRIENYQNNLQCIIEQFVIAREGSFDLADLLPHTAKNVPEMRSAVERSLRKVGNHHLRALLDAYLEDDKLMASFCKAPAAMSFHHAYLGGLLEHTLNAIEVADAVCPFYPGLNRDLVVAGIFLHDIAKTWELTYDTGFGYSDGGQLVGHIVKSAIWVERKQAVAESRLGEKIPTALIDLIQHIILSHHDKPEFGSPKVPATPEALAVHMIENMDAKLMMSLTATRGEAAVGCEGPWTEYQRAFNTRLYRPDLAPSDAPAGAAPSPAPDSASAGQAPRITNPLFEPAPARRR